MKDVLLALATAVVTTTTEPSRHALPSFDPSADAAIAHMKTSVCGSAPGYFGKVDDPIEITDSDLRLVRPQRRTCIVHPSLTPTR